MLLIDNLRTFVWAGLLLSLVLPVGLVILSFVVVLVLPVSIGGGFTIVEVTALLRLEDGTALSREDAGFSCRRPHHASCRL